MLHNAYVRERSVVVSPPSATAVPFIWPSSQYSCSIIAAVCLQGEWFLTTFYDMCNAWALGWFNPFLFHPFESSPHPPLTGKSWFTRSPIKTLGWCGMLSPNRAPGCAENQALGNQQWSVEHVLLHALVKYTMQLALQHCGPRGSL